MSPEPITVTTTHDTPLFDPEDHRKMAAPQLGVTPDEIQCIACGPDTFERVSEAVYSEDGTLLKAAVVKYHRSTTWELRPRPPAPPEPVKEEPVNHYQPTLARGARWHGIINGVEGNYISDGSKLVPTDSPEGQAVTEALRKESGTASPPVG